MSLNLKQTWFYFQYLFLRMLAWMTTSLNEAGVRALSKATGSLLFLRKRRRRISTDNIRFAFPQKSEAEIQEISKKSFQQMMLVILEFIRIPLISKNSKSFIEIRGAEHVDRALAQKRGLVLSVAHFGNWELMGVAAADRGWPMHAIGKPLKNPFIYEYIKKLRGATGLHSIDKVGAIQKIVQLLKQNQIIAMLIDEHVKKGEVWVNFLGRKAAVSSLPAMLNLRYKVPIIPTFYFRSKKGSSVLWFGKPFEEIQTGNIHEDLVANTQLYVKALENEIRKRPEDWTLWMHNRWRKQAA